MTETGTTQPDLAEAFRLIFRTFSESMWTSLPGYVDSYDASKQSAEVVPAVKGWRLLLDGEEQDELPKIPNVPVIQPSGGGFHASFPLQKGDPVVLVFAARDIDAWKSSPPGAPVQAQDNRIHDLTDCFAIPGGRPLAAPFLDSDANDLIIGKDGGHRLKIPQDGASARLGTDAGHRLDVDSSNAKLGTDIGHSLAVSSDAATLGSSSGQQVRVSAAAIELGSAAGGLDSVALGAKVLAELAIIKAEMTAQVAAYNLHTHSSIGTYTAEPPPPAGGGEIVDVGITTFQQPIPIPPTAVGSSTVSAQV